VKGAEPKIPTSAPDASRNPVPSTSAPEVATQSEIPSHDPLARNTDSILAFYTREEKNITISQRILESIGDKLGSPSGLGVVVSIIILWMFVNSIGRRFDIVVFDPPPFS
jgi:uncharacterized membrane protein